MKTELIVLFAVVSITAAQIPDIKDQKCKPNESFKTCGTACEPSCEQPGPRPCTKQCVIGCQCDNGFFRNSDGDCVKLEECKSVPTKCPANETFSECHNPCTEPKCPRKGAPVVRCMMMCQKACGCSPGFARNLKGQCIKRLDCPKSVYPDVPATEPSPRVKRSSCMTMKCSRGFECQDKEGRGQCVPTTESTIEPVGSCMTMKCATPGGCAMVLPEACLDGNCKAQPMCVNANPCHWVRCRKCVLRQVTCVKAPCDPVAECM